MKTTSILIPLPDEDFDVTEVSVPWKVLRGSGHRIVFATETGAAPAPDPRLLEGVIFGKLGAEPEPKAFFAEMQRTRAYREPQVWCELDMTDFDALLLPGGHAPGMRQYLSSEVLQTKVAEFWALNRPVAAICHGTVVLARARDREGRSLLHDQRTTCLPRYMERLAYYMTSWKLGRYYRTYPEYVETEVRKCLVNSSQFERGPMTLGERGTGEDDRHAFVVESGRYISARWPGDAYLFARKLDALLRG